MKHRKIIFRIIAFCALLAILVTLINKILTPKFMYDNTWPTTQTYLDFYDMEKNTIDVLFFGSSHAVSSFSPIEIYKNYEICSYNLGCEQQNLLVSYYWLNEALKYQSPSVVVLDTRMLFPYNTKEPLNTAEPMTRKAIDYMRWSSNKVNAIKDICNCDENQTETSYYLKNIRFHTRWTSLNEDDFTYEKKSDLGLMGYSAINSLVTEYDCNRYSTFIDGETNEVDEPVSIMLEYLDKIVKLCKENDIDLILCKTPVVDGGSVKQYNYLKAYSKENDLRYINFNEKTVYNDCHFVYGDDAADSGHSNYKGALKISNYIGNMLVNEYDIKRKNNIQFDEKIEIYNNAIKDCKLKEIETFNEYLEQINDSRYAIFISVKDEAISGLSDKMISKLTDLGATVNFREMYRSSYYLIKTSDNIYEVASSDSIEKKGTIRNGLVSYNLVSSGFDCGNTSSILIDGVEYSKNSRGMNIVVYSLDRKKVIDSVCFDTFGDSTATR